jgi:hypothetical protein
MYRQRMHLFPKTQEAWMEVIQVGEEWNKLAAERGWAQATIFMPVAGEVEFVAEFDYPDLATFQRENEETYTVPEAMAISRKLMGIDAARTPYFELLSTMPAAA